MSTTAQIEKGDRVRLLDRPGDVRGVVVEVSTAPYRTVHPIRVELKPGRSDATFWFGAEELEVLS